MPEIHSFIPENRRAALISVVQFFIRTRNVTAKNFFSSHLTEVGYDFHHSYWQHYIKNVRSQGENQIPIDKVIVKATSEYFKTLRRNEIPHWVVSAYEEGIGKSEELSPGLEEVTPKNDSLTKIDLFRILGIDVNNLVYPRNISGVYEVFRYARQSRLITGRANWSSDDPKKGIHLTYAALEIFGRKENGNMLEFRFSYLFSPESEKEPTKIEGAILPFEGCIAIISSDVNGLLFMIFENKEFNRSWPSGILVRNHSDDGPIAGKVVIRRVTDKLFDEIESRSGEIPVEATNIPENILRIINNRVALYGRSVLNVRDLSIISDE